MGHAAMLTYMYFNKRVMNHCNAPSSAAWDAVIDAMELDAIEDVDEAVDLLSDDDIAMSSIDA
jgi:hypothetical protein